MSNTPTSSAQVAEGMNLLPCPFCGGAARIESNRDWHRLYCAHDDDCALDADEADLMYPAQPGYLLEIAEVWNRRTAAPVAEGVALPPLDAEGLLPLPEMLEATDLAYVLETPADWDADYRATWQKLQVSDCNRRQWRTYALQLRAALIAYIDGRTAGPAVPDWQPIETAPQDKMLLLAAEFDGPGDWRIKVGGFWDRKWNVFGATWTPTRWMPLPAAPKPQEDA